MKLSLLVFCFLAIVCFSFSEAAEESSSLKQNSKHNIDFYMEREARSAGRKAKKSKRKNKKRSGKKNQRKSGKKNGRKSQRKNKRKSGKKGSKIEGKEREQIGQKKGRKSIKPIATVKTSKASVRANLVGSHCEFVDLCVIDRMSESGCNMGDKFVIKSPRGVRRQFLMVDGSKIIAFLKNGKKITDCPGNLTDVTNKVTCKAVAGAGTLKLQRQNSTNEPTTAAAPAPTTNDEATNEAPTTGGAPTTEEAPTTDVMPPLQAGQFHCPCPTRTCFTTITSTNNMHKIECGSKTFNVPCGGPLKGSKIGLLISIIDVFEQPLCSTNTYVTLIKDLVWKCSDLNIPEDGPCEGDKTTAAPETTGPDSSDASMGAMTTGGPDVSSTDSVPTTASGAITTPSGAITTPSGAITTPSGTITTPSGATTTASGTTTTASGTTTTASGTTTTASGTTTTASGTTTTASVTTTTTTAAVTTTTTTTT